MIPRAEPTALTPNDRRILKAIALSWAIGGWRGAIYWVRARSRYFLTVQVPRGWRALVDAPRSVR